MKKFFILLVIAIFSVTMFAVNVDDQKVKKIAKKCHSAKCPVSLTDIKDVKKAPKSMLKGKTFYFCCEDAKKKFDKEPAKYLKKVKEMHMKKKAHKKHHTAKCPVSLTEIKDVKKAPKSVLKGKTFYFCCEDAKKKFDKEPAKYLKKVKEMHMKKKKKEAKKCDQDCNSCKDQKKVEKKK